MPLILDSGDAILVDRGWLLSENTGTAVNDIPAAARQGRSSIEGWVRRNATGNSTRVTDVADGVADDTGDFLDQDRGGGGPTAASGIRRPRHGGPGARRNHCLPAELPDVGNGPHFFYGLQWWFFGLLAVGGFGYLAYDEWRGPRKRAPDEIGRGTHVVTVMVPETGPVRNWVR